MKTILALFIPDPCERQLRARDTAVETSDSFLRPALCRQGSSSVCHKAHGAKRCAHQALANFAQQSADSRKKGDCQGVLWLPQILGKDCNQWITYPTDYCPDYH